MTAIDTDRAGLSAVDWPHGAEPEIPPSESDDRKLGKRQLRVLQMTLAAHKRLNRPVTARDLGMTSAADRGMVYQVWNGLAKRGLVERSEDGTIPLAAATVYDAVAAPAEREESAPVIGARKRVLFVRRVAPDDATGTVFRGTIANPPANPFMPGENSRKLGARVVKGMWADMPLFSLTIEERATCPRSCHHWTSCYGNNMPLAKRFRHGPELEDRIRSALWDLDRLNPAGYVIRLHVLGDFYSVPYAMMWREMMERHPPLRVFGYTANPPESEIGRIIRFTRTLFRHRWAVRFSGAKVAFSARTIGFIPTVARQKDGMVCPQQLDLVGTCAECALCWQSDEPILFIDHALLSDEE